MGNPYERWAALKAVATSKVDIDRRATATLLRRIYDSDAGWLVRKRPSEPPAHFAMKQKFTPNLLRQALDQTCTLYRQDPARASSTADEWSKYLWRYGCGLSPVLDEALPLAKLLGQAILMPVYLTSPDAVSRWANGDVTTPEDAGISTWVKTPEQCVALPLEQAPGVAEAIMVYVATSSDGKTQWWHYWDSEAWALVEAKGGGSSFELKRVEYAGGVDFIPHGYGRIPMAVADWELHSSKGAFWAPGWGGVDLATNLQALYTCWTEYLWVTYLQRGQPTVSGGKITGEAALGPDTILVTEPGAVFSIVSNGADVPGLGQALTDAIGAFAKSLGLPTRMVRITPAEPASGIAITLERAELEDIRKKDALVWQTNERALHRAAAAVARVELGATLDPKVDVVYRPLPRELTPGELLLELQFELSQGTITRSQMAARLHPELSADEIEARILASESERTPDVDDTPDVEKVVSGNVA